MDTGLGRGSPLAQAQPLSCGEEAGREATGNRAEGEPCSLPVEQPPAFTARVASTAHRPQLSPSGC